MMNIERKLLSRRYEKGVNTLCSHDKGVHQCCPACGSDTGYLISEIDREGVACDTVVCRNCSLIFNNSYIKTSESYYENVFAKKRWQNPEASFLRRTAPDSYSWRRLGWLINTLDIPLNSQLKVLEIGCGDGCNLYPYHMLGYDVTGCDYADDFLVPGRKRGMRLVNGDFTELDGVFDVILLIHSFEHMMNLDEVVQNISRYLSAEGIVYVEVPGFRNNVRKRVDSFAEDGYTSNNNFMSYLQYQHNFHFDLSSLRFFWERNGFTVIKGDEWVRLVLKKGERALHKCDEQKVILDSLSYLQAVEKDFLSLSTLFWKGTRKILTHFKIA